MIYILSRLSTYNIRHGKAVALGLPWTKYRRFKFSSWTAFSPESDDVPLPGRHGRPRELNTAGTLHADWLQTDWAQ
ncbi:hypothetical protein EVAR_75079_1 [Eumeta japonica]|uniref:Uncharacterized protein n=1 Tax=Eumeta variegata TaxID=151549 RepID=A0A4C1W243_EUMVA|nr:hypothetical protein EVAR_75079_1 [Eumeta japonica]